MSRPTRFLPAAVLAIALLPLAAEAQSPTVPGRVPSGAIMAVSVRNPSALYQGIQNTPVEAAFDRLADQVFPAHSPSWQRFRSESQSVAVRLQSPLSLRGLMTVVVRGFDYYVIAPPSPGAPADWVVMVSFASQMAGDGLLNGLRTEAMQADPDGVREEQVGAGKLILMPREGLTVATIGPIVCVASSERAARQVLNARDNDELTKSDNFDTVMWGLAELSEAPAWFYADGAKLRAAAEAGSLWFLPPSAAADIPDTLGGQVRPAPGGGFLFTTATPPGEAAPTGASLPRWERRLQALGLNATFTTRSRTESFGTVTETTLTLR